MVVQAVTGQPLLAQTPANAMQYPAAFVPGLTQGAVPVYPQVSVPCTDESLVFYNCDAVI